MPDGSIDATADDSASLPDLFSRLPPHILGSLTGEQRRAIAAAADQPGWTDHRINIRLSVPFLPKRWYITIVGGPERRHKVRRYLDRRRNPVNTAGNFAFVVVAAAFFYGLAAIAILMSSSVIEY